MPPRKGTKKASTQAVVVEAVVPDSPLTTSDKAVNHLIANLDVLYDANVDVATSMTSTVKVLYDYLKQHESKDYTVDNALPELLVDGFDSEQIWEQLKLQMDPMIENTETFVASFVLADEDMKENSAEEEDLMFDEEDEEDHMFDDEDEETMEYLLNKEEANIVSMKSNSKKKNVVKKAKLSVPKELKHLQDKFFDLEDMHRFADEGEFEDDNNAKLEMKALRRRTLLEAGEIEEDEELSDENEQNEDDESNPNHVDVFEDVVVQDKDKFMYSDFFLPPNEDNEGEEEEEMDMDSILDSWEGDINGLEGDDDDDLDMGLFNMDGEGDDDQEQAKLQFLEEDDEENFLDINDEEHVVDHLLPPSTYQKRQSKMTDQISAIEKQLMGPKSWDMTGESKSHTRELDILLDADLDFEFATKAALPITEEIASEIEQIIRNRIKDNAFDDVQAKFQAPEKLYEAREEVNSEKSKYGLAEIYEKEYLQMAQGTATDAQMKLNDQHRDITELFTELCHKLDALSNYFYTPKSKNMELQVISTSNAINMEEVLPMAVNDTVRAAPQEIFQAASRGLIASREEQDKEEKDAHRKNKKDKKRRHFEIEEIKLQQNALAGDEKSKKVVEQKDMAKRYKEATGSKQVVQVGNTDNTKYSTSAQFFQKLTDTNAKEKAGVKVKPKTKLQEQGGKASKYMS